MTQVTPTQEQNQSKILDDVEEKGAEENLKSHFNKFQLLELVESDVDNLDDDDDEEIKSTSNESSDESKVRKQHVSSKQPSATSKQRGTRRRRNKKTKTFAKSTIDDEFELNPTLSTNDSSAPTKSHKIDDIRQKLLKLDMRNLIPELELKRMFGKSVLGERAKENRPRNAGFQRSRFVTSSYIGDLRAIPSKPSPKMELDDYFNNGQTCSLEPVVEQKRGKKNTLVNQNPTSLGSDRPLYFKFTHDKSYQEAHALFLEAVHNGNPESIIQNVNFCPTHVESLIQLSHIFRISEDFKTSADFIETSLMIFERGFHPRFNVALANCRLTYRRPENRAFFITIFEHIQYLNRRGLRRTPLEYTKLLISLDPDNDPLLAVQLIDFYSIRSEEYGYLIEFINSWTQLSGFPNMNFSLALAHFLKSRCTKQSKKDSEAHLKMANDILQRSLLIFPNFIIPLLDACSAEPSSELRKCNYFDYTIYSNKYKNVPEAVEVLVSLYVQRNSMLWKAKHVMAWLESQIAEMVNKFATGELVDDGQHLKHWSSFKGPVPRNLLRHIALSDLKIKIPESATGVTVLDTDPYPPTEPLISYQLKDVATSSRVAATGGFTTFLRSVLPSFSLEDSNRTQEFRLTDRLMQSQSNATSQEPQQREHDEVMLNESLESIQESIRGLVSSMANLLTLTQGEREQPPDEQNNHDDDHEGNV